MKLSTSLLLPALIGAASATSDAAVYLFQGDDWPNDSNPPSLTPEQARLIFAQRLGTSRYHGLGDASESTLSYINQFGGRQESLFDDSSKDKAAELVLIVEGFSRETAAPLLKAWSSFKPAFTVAEPPSIFANHNLVVDLQEQYGPEDSKCEDQDLESAINPLDATCWSGRSKVIHFDLSNKMVQDQLLVAQQTLIRFAKNGEMNALIAFMPESSRGSNDIPNVYGLYEKAGQQPIVKARREPAEEPITEASSVISTPLFYSKQVQATNSSTNSSQLIYGVLPSCFSSLESCIATTYNCSGRGECYKKYSGGSSKSSCFTCGCRATNETFRSEKGDRFVLTNWGGSGCQKEDVSGPFWLILIFTSVLVGLITWAIGLMYSIGEEKLPGVIGAGVSSKAR